MYIYIYIYIYIVLKRYMPCVKGLFRKAYIMDTTNLGGKAYIM